MQRRPSRNAFASVAMVMLMVSMSLSSGLLEVNRAPWLEADTSSTDVARTYAPMSPSGCVQSNATNYDSGAVVSDGSCVFPLSSSFSGSEFIIGESSTPIEFGYDPTDPDTHSWASASNAAANIGFEEGQASSLLAQDQSMDPIQFNLAWDNFTVPNTFSADELGYFSFNNDVNDTSPDPVQNSTWSLDVLTLDRHGRTNNALTLEGGNDSVTYGGSNFSDLNNFQYEFTQAMWLRPTNNEGHQVLIKNHPNQFLLIDDGEVNFRYRQDYSGVWDDNKINTVLENDTWYHVAFTGAYFTGNKTFFVQAYINGSLEQSFTHSGQNANVAGFTSGGSNFQWGGESGGGADRAFNGTLDDYYSFNDHYNATQIQGLMNIGGVAWSITPDLPEGLIFDGFTGRISGTPTQQTAAQAYEVSANSTSGTNHTRAITLGVVSLQGLLPVDEATCTVSPALPAGLTLNATTCIINGTPTTVSAARTYSVSAQIDGETFVNTLTFAVHWDVVASEPMTKSPRATTITPVTFNWTLWSSGVLNSTTDVYTTGNSGNYNGLVVDSNDKVHIVYYRDDNANLMYATNSTGSWQTSTIESNNNVGRYCNLALDSSNGLHVSYQYNSGNALRYAYKSASSSTWSTTTVDSTGGKFTSIAIDSNDKPHIAYRDSGGDVGYAEKTGYSWTFGKLQSASDVAFTSIAVDSNDHLHLAYYDAVNKNMFHLSDLSGSWVRTTLEDIGTNTGGTSLDIAIDPTTDEPGISYFDMDATSLKYMHYTGSSWVASTVEDGSDYGRWNSLAYDSAGNVHISHERNVADDLYYSSDKTGSWVTTAVDTSGSVGTHTSIDVDSNDDIHIAYRYNTGTDTRHATVQGFTPLTVPRYDVSGATCSISPALPSGLTLNQGSCSITGTPTAAGNNVTYNLTVTSTTGNTQFGEFSLWVTSIAPSIAYPAFAHYFTVNTTTVNLVPNNAGDPATWSIAPTLPSGMVFNSSTGAITGTPTVLQTTGQNHTIWANNSGGSSTTQVNLTINDNAPSNVAYSRSSYTFEMGSPANITPPTVAGGIVTAWWISPSLPSGLEFNASNGAITGTPTVLQTTPVTYTVTATNSGGSASTTLSMGVLAQAPFSLSYTPSNGVVTVNTSLTPTPPTVAGGDVTAWSISPSLPSGLELNATTGAITGTPTVLQTTPVTYTVTATNSGGSATATFSMRILALAPSSLSYTPSNVVVTVNTTLTPLVPSVSGGAITSWSISGSAPSGLNFGSSNGTIWGTPTQLTNGTQTFMIWANNSGGSTATNITVTVNDVAPSNIAYSSSSFTFEMGSPVNITPPTVAGGGVTAWSISPSLPSGLELNSTTGAVTGTPTVLQTTPVTYTVTGTNSGGSGTSTFSMGILAQAPSSLSYTPSNVVVTVNTPLTPMVPSISGGAITSWWISSSGPAGLNFGPNNGTIWGTPTQLTNGTQTFMIWANNSGGSTATNITVTVNDAVPGPFEYDPENNTWTNNSEVHLAPQFINLTTGNGSTWRVADINSGVGNSNPGSYTKILVDDTLYFSANDGSTGDELWAHNTSNGTTWQVANIRPSSSSSNPGSNMMHVVNGVLYFNAHDGNAGMELWKHEPSTGTTSRVHDINPGSTGSSTGKWMSLVVGDVLYFSANGGSRGIELWAHDTSNASTWRVTDIRSGTGSSSNPGQDMAILVGDTLYFSANHGSSGIELWAHDTSNASTWRVADINSGTGSSYPGDYMEKLVGDTLYFSANDGSSGNELWAHRPSSIDYNTNTGGPVTSWAINASLPSGVTFNTQTGVLSGTPTELWPQTSYMVWANNSGGSSVAYLNITVVDELPTTAYSPNDLSMTNNTASSDLPLSPTVTGSGTITSWAISPSVPSGLAFDTSTGILSGTPTELLTRSMYTITATNTGGTATAYINITIVDEVPTIDYSPNDLDLTNNTASSDLPLSPTITGSGEFTSWAISPSVPSGLAFSTSTGVLSGTPTELLTRSMYTITATNTGGTATTYINITVVDELPTLSYSPENLTLTKGQSSTDLPLNATLTGSGAITSWAISPALPSGLNFGTSNGTVWGIPTVLQTTAVTYTIWANNSGGSENATINITTNDVAPSISYSLDDIVATLNVSISPHSSPTKTGGAVTSWEISPDPGPAFHFNTFNGVISGTPGILLSRTQYTVYANNSGGSSFAYVNVTINDQLPTLSYTPENLTLTKGQSSSDLPLSATVSGSGTITSWAISPVLPSGLSFGTSNGTIWGIATVLQTSPVTYTVWANNSGGSDNATINITIVDGLPTLSYSPNGVVLTNNTTSSDLPLLATLTGSGEITSWAINATLPAGLTFETSNGTIWGTPTELWTQTAYTVWANNSGGSSVAYLNITVNDQVPTSVVYASTPLILVNNTNPSSNSYPPAVSGGGSIVSWAINATLPSGLMFGPTNGTFYGTPTELWERTSYTVWANNSGGSILAYMNITVNDQVPTPTYSPNTVVLVVNQTSNDFPLLPTLTGQGAITSWELVGTLPTGLQFGSTNGTFWGIPTALQTSPLTYTVWANNTGGSAQVNLQLSVVDAEPSSLSYTPSGQVVWMNSTMTSMMPTVVGGGPITNWTIAPSSLPSGVQFNEQNGRLSGTPIELWSNTTYTVQASNSGGSVSATVWLMVSLNAPNIAYPVLNISLVSNQSVVNYNGTNSGGQLFHGSATINAYDDVFCTVSEESEVWCWGENDDKLVRYSGSTSSDYAPTKVPMPTGRLATSVGVGYEFACALLDNGSVACWGDAGTNWRYGSSALKQWDGDGYITPQLMAGIGSARPAKTLEVGFAHACVTFETGVPQCWGTNVWGNLGTADSSSAVAPTNMSVIPSNRTVLQLSLGIIHACALLDNASVMCWGDNDYGALGDNSTTERSTPVWPDLGGRAVRTVSAGDRSTCVGFASGGAACWGRNANGQLGDNSTTDRWVPVNVTGLDTNDVFVSFSPGYLTTCGRLTDGETLCWGAVTGQGNGSSLVPAEVEFASNGTATDIAVEGNTVCAVLVNGTVTCWGSGNNRAFGLVTSPSSSTTPVYGVLGVPARNHTGGWVLDGVLPDGLQFSSTNGTLWGTPVAVNVGWVNYTVRAYNSAGSSTYSFSLQVLDQLPGFSYTPSTLNLIKGLNDSHLPLVPSMTGAGDITSWAISPALPGGLQFSTVNGTVSGWPSSLLNTTEFTVWANNSGGSSSATFNLTVIDQVPTLAYVPSDLTLVRGETSTDLPLEANVSGAGDFVTWAVSPALPTGLFFDTSNGTVSGIPTVNASLAVYTVTASNSGGTRTFTLNITVIEPLAVLSYAPSDLNLTRGLAMTVLSPSQSGGTVAQWGLSPALPAGLNFSNGVFSGTPTVNQTTTEYTVWANNSGGSTSVLVNITIDEPVGALSYTPQNLTLYRNVTMNPLSPTYTGGVVDEWSVEPALPSGLTFTNGVISGTPQTTVTTTAAYTVWANHSGGSVSASFNLTVLEPLVVVVYSPSDVVLVRNDTVLNLVPSVSGGTPDSWAIHPALPQGLVFTNGQITGTAQVNMTRTTYNVWANTTGGNNVVQLNLTVVEPLVEFIFNPDEVVLTRSQTMNNISATFNGGAVASWGVEPALPEGLTFSDGVLSGTPAINMTRTEYTLWANNSGGSTSVTINVTVLEPAVVFAYQPNVLELTRNQSMTVVSPTIINDAMAESWGISPALPAGMVFDNGSLYGRPTVNLTTTSFTVWANNSGGPTARVLTITVLEPVANVVYAPQNMTVTRGQENLSMVPVLGGGAVASWSIFPDLPAGLTFENGTLAGVAAVQFPLTMYTVTAENSGGIARAMLNLTVLEPVAEISINGSLVATRGKAPVNATVNNTGGSVDTWAVSPALPSGVQLINGWIYGSARVNMSQTTYTVWANNSGGSANVSFTLEILEPRAIIGYADASLELVTGITNLRVRPLVSGGVPDQWSISPALPEGLEFSNGAIIGVAVESMEASTYTVWANNSGGSASTSLTIQIDWPLHFARYPVPRLVLDVNETLPPQYPVYSFDGVRGLSWTVHPALPDGFDFSSGVVSGLSVNASNETTYTVTVTGEMAPVQLNFTLEVRGLEVEEVAALENNNTVEEIFIVPEQEVFDTSFNMYYLCPPILIFVMLLGAMAINNFLKRTGYVELEDEAAEASGELPE